MHVVHLTSVHPPFDNRIFHKECQAVRAAGHQVTLIAPHFSTERVDGVRVVGVGRANSRWRRWMRIVPAVLREAIKQDGDVYHFHDPELIPVGLWLRLRGKRVIYDVHEDLPRQIQGKSWIPKFIQPVIAVVASLTEVIFSLLTTGIVAATPTIARRFSTKKTRIVRNFPRLRLNWFGEESPYTERESIVVHPSATIGLIRGAREMVAAMNHLRDRNARLLLIGDMTPGLADELRREPGWRNVDWIARLHADEIPKHLRRARVGLNVLHDVPNYRDALPTKVYEFMAAGLPIVLSDFPLWREQYEPVGCALFVDPYDPVEIAEAIRWLLEHPREAEEMGRRGRDRVQSVWNWETEQKTLIEMYDQLAA